jgi:hypothetical protein
LAQKAHVTDNFFALSFRRLDLFSTFTKQVGYFIKVLSSLGRLGEVFFIRSTFSAIILSEAAFYSIS